MSASKSIQYALRSRVYGLRKVEGLGSGPIGKIATMRRCVTELLRHERLELPYARAVESRGYAERLIQLAVRHGDTHKPTMDLADFWLIDKDMVRKLFKVLVPRFSEFNESYTRMYHLPIAYPGYGNQLALIELKGNPWPPVNAFHRDKRGWLINVLVNAAREDSRSRPVLSASESKADSVSPQTDSAN